MEHQMYAEFTLRGIIILLVASRMIIVINNRKETNLFIVSFLTLLVCLCFVVYVCVRDIEVAS